MIKSEAAFQTLFSHWLKAKFLPAREGGFAFELKHAHGKKFLPYSRVEPHQVAALLATRTIGLYYKLSDESRGWKPYDCFAMKGCDAYVVIKYPSCFVLIDVRDFIKEKEYARGKSLKENRAKEIAEIVVEMG